MCLGNAQADDPDGWWQLKPNARLPSEAELRRMLSPDQWCLYDSTKAGQHRLWEQGISRPDLLSQIPAERMQIAIEQLPEVQMLPTTSCQALCHAYLQAFPKHFMEQQ